MLDCETNTAKMARRVSGAARKQLKLRRLQVDFEHGQWWVTDLRSGAQWSVTDANTTSGFDFEQVTEGDRE